VSSISTGIDEGTDWISSPETNYTEHRLLIGTHTADGRQNHIEIATVNLPKPKKADVKDYNEETGEVGGYGGGPTSKGQFEAKFSIRQKIDHPGEVNKARYQPQNPNMIATMCTDGRVRVWDKTKYSTVLQSSSKAEPHQPTFELQGHTKEGYGLSWNPFAEGHLATASEDCTVRLWDTTQGSKTNRVIPQSRQYTHHSGIVNDVQYHPLLPNLVGTVSDDLTMQLLDLRQPDTSRAAAKAEKQHKDAINAIAFNLSQETVVATGSADKTIALLDLRNLKDKLHVLEGHHDSVTTLEWHPFEEAVLASSSYDRRINFWDLARVGEEQTPEDSEDGHPELLFMHGGHTNRISDFSWNKNSPWVVCSAADDNLIQVWKVAEAIVGQDEDDVPMHELEG
jgi:histone-binding protein RBBP4